MIGVLDDSGPLNSESMKFIEIGNPFPDQPGFERFLLSLLTRPVDSLGFFWADSRKARKDFMFCQVPKGSSSISPAGAWFSF